MAEIQAPALNEKLTPCDSKESAELKVDTYRDLFEIIEATIQSVKSAMETHNTGVVDFTFNLEMNGVLDRALLPQTDLGTLSSDASRLQDLINNSSLNNPAKIALWAPIAECYANIRNALTTKIKPIEEREAVRVGDTIEAPVRFVSGESANISAAILIDPLQYTLGGKPLKILMLLEEDIHKISEAVLIGFAQVCKTQHTIDLPVEITTEEDGALIIGRLDLTKVPQPS
jgi:hypothetical protein